MAFAIHYIMGAGAAALATGFVAEQVMSKDARAQADAVGDWQARHDEFLAGNPKPEGAHVFVGAEPTWKHAAILGGAGVAATAVGGLAAFGAHRMAPQNYPMFVTGVTLATIGAGVAGGAVLSSKAPDVNLAIAGGITGGLGGALVGSRFGGLVGAGVGAALLGAGAAVGGWLLEK